MVSLNLSDTAATSQDGLSLEFITPSAIFRMQVAEGCDSACIISYEYAFRKPFGLSSVS